MVLAQTLKSRLGSLFLSIVIFLNAGISLSRAQEEDSAMGELKLEGKHIQQLVLQSRDGKRESFDKPGESITLPAGEYRLREVHLEGGYVSRVQIVPDDWVTADKDKPAVLKVGAPLKQTVKVQRQRNLLVLNYELLGVGGESYTHRDRSKRPQFTVYKGTKKITTRKFEYG